MFICGIQFAFESLVRPAGFEPTRDAVLAAEPNRMTAGCVYRFRHGRTSKS